MKKLYFVIAAVILQLAIIHQNGFSQAAFSFTAGNLSYAETFDGMGAAGTALPTGWLSTDATIAVTNGTATSGGSYNVGPTGLTDRAIGTLASGTLAPKFGASFVNGTGDIITEIDFAGVCEQWRSGTDNTVNEVVAFEYSFNATSLTTGTWTAVTAFDLDEILTTTTAGAAVDGNLNANKDTISASITSLMWTDGDTLWIRWTDIDNAGSDGMYAIDDLEIDVTLALNDFNSSVYAPLMQIPAGTIPSTATNAGSAVTFMGFMMRDSAGGDGLVTDVTKIRVKPAVNNTADWTDNIAGAVLTHGVYVNTPITVDTVIITDTYLDFVINAGDFQIADGDEDTVGFSIFLNSGNLTDGGIIAMMVDADAHGFEADGAGSIFSPIFTADVVSNDFEITVAATQIIFVQEPTDVYVGDPIAPAVTVAFVDANNNVDIDITDTIRISATGGTLTDTPIDSVVVNGIATFDNVSFTVSATGVVLDAADKNNVLGVSATVTSAAFDVNDVPVIPDILISEVADPQDSTNARFVEIFNPGTSDVDLDAADWYLSKQANGGATWSDMKLSGIITAGATFVVATDSVVFFNSYGFNPEMDNASLINGNGNDAYYLYYGGNHTTGALVDIYGQLNTDGSGLVWDYLDGRAVRNEGIVLPNTTWTASEWTITRPLTHAGMTPGVHPDIYVDSLKPEITDLQVINDSTITLTFNELLDQATAEDTANFVFLSGILVDDAVLTTNTITLTLASYLTYDEYDTLIVSLVEDTAGNVMIADTLVFFYAVSGDTTEPFIVSVDVIDAATLTVTFSEAMDTVSADPYAATNLVNYAGLDIATAVPSINMEVITLTLNTPLTSGVADTLIVFDVADTAGNVLAEADTFVVTWFAPAPPRIIISQFYEGSSSNKWVEITNMDTMAVDLADYYLAMWSIGGSSGNGLISGSPNFRDTLVGVIAPGQTLSFKNTAATLPSYATGTANTAINFNGNDAIALVDADTVIIDAFGDGINSKDISYYRIASVTAPNATFTLSEWVSVSYTFVDSALAMTTEYIGYHVTGPDTVAPAWVNPYPAAANINSSGFDVSINIDEQGSVYYVVLDNGAAEPSVAQVKAGQDASGSAVTVGMAGTISATAGYSVFSAPVTGLTITTTYDIYLVAQDDEVTPNVQDTVTMIQATTTFADTAAPLFDSIYPAISGITNNSFDVEVSLDEEGTAYFVVLPNNDPAPSTTQVMAGQDASGTPVAVTSAGTLSISTATTVFTGSATLLTAETDYDVYVVAKDNEATPNVQAAPVKLDATTLADPTASDLLFISEVADPLDSANAKFIELYNADTAAVNFDQE
ncbi:MAG: lamin tail domain-containing protein, partial [Bacteroidetes bacterium]|nr:lamin tail domain-containing protein [Bacteroidota bacterium]